LDIFIVFVFNDDVEEYHYHSLRSLSIPQKIFSKFRRYYPILSPKEDGISGGNIKNKIKCQIVDQSQPPGIAAVNLESIFSPGCHHLLGPPGVKSHADHGTCPVIARYL
jgi:hypothetical protein